MTKTMTSDNMPQIKRYELCNCVPNDGTTGGTAVLYSDHVAARAADKAEIERLQKNCTRWRRVADHHVNVTERFQARAEKAEARIAELEASLRADRRDAERLRQFDWWANYGLCPHLVFNDNGWWAVSFDGGGDISLDEPPPAGSFTASVEARQWRETVGEAIDAAIAAEKPNPQGERRTE